MPFVLQSVFLPNSLSSPSRMYARPLTIVSLIPEANLLKISFSLFLRLDDFYSSVFKFADFFLCHIHSAVKRFIGILRFQVLCFLVLRFPFSSVL